MERSQMAETGTSARLGVNGHFRARLCFFRESSLPMSKSMSESSSTTSGEADSTRSSQQTVDQTVDQGWAII